MLRPCPLTVSDWPQLREWPNDTLHVLRCRDMPIAFQRHPLGCDEPKVMKLDAVSKTPIDPNRSDESFGERRIRRDAELIVKFFC